MFLFAHHGRLSRTGVFALCQRSACAPARSLRHRGQGHADEALRIGLSTRSSEAGRWSKSALRLAAPLPGAAVRIPTTKRLLAAQASGRSSPTSRWETGQRRLRRRR